MKEIILTKGQKAIVDDDMFEKVGRFNWYADPTPVVFYARRAITLPSGKQKKVSLSDSVLPPKTGFVVDHKNGDTLDYRRGNLRYATQLQNRQNSKKSKCGNPHKGVFKATRKYKDKTYSYWTARIGVGGKQKFLGSFSIVADAVEAYNAAAAKYHGEFARFK